MAIRPRKHNKPNFIYANTHLEEIPFHYQGYIKAHRHFESVVAEYEPFYKGLAVEKNFEEWINCYIRDDIKTLEDMINKVEAGEMDLGEFREYRHEMANGQLQCSLDSFSCPTYQAKSEKDNAIMDDYITMIDRIHDKIRQAGYVIYEYWIDSRLVDAKIY